MLLRHAIGYVLRRRRLDRGQTLRQLAEQASISLPYLSEIERGRKEVSSEILWVLCRVLDLTEEQLLRDAAAEYSQAASLESAPASHEVVNITRGARLLAA